MRTAVLLGLAVVIAITGRAWAVDAASVPTIKRTKLEQYLSAQEAADFITKNSKTLFLDVRTPAEVAFVGMPTTADANVPYMVVPDFPIWDDARSTFKLEANSDFVPEVRRRLAAKGLDADSPVVLICRSGDRSAAATNLL